jgi:hypothetical protein
MNLFPANGLSIPQQAKLIEIMMMYVVLLMQRQLA